MSNHRSISLNKYDTGDQAGEILTCQDWKQQFLDGNLKVNNDI